MREFSTRNGWKHTLGACFLIFTAVISMEAATLTSPTAWAPESLLTVTAGTDDGCLAIAEVDEPIEDIQWIEVTLEEGGQLIRKLLTNPLVDQVQDIENLRVIGPLADDDWNAIAAMVKLLRADFSQAQFKVLPAVLSKTLTEVSLPEGLEEIGAAALYGTSISKIQIPSSLTKISGSAFKTCKNLVEILLPTECKLEYLGYAAFEGTAIREFSIPETVSFIGEALFYKCGALTKLHFPSSVEVIPAAVARACTKLTEVNFPLKIREIQSSAFSGTSLKEVDLSNTKVEAIGYEAFGNNDSLESIIFPDSMHSLEGVLAECWNLKSVKLPKELDVMGGGMFHYCKSLEELILPGKLGGLYWRSDENNVFWGNPFYGCNNLTTVTLPVSLAHTNMGGYDITDLFRSYYTPNLTKIICPSPTVPLGQPVTSEQLANITLVVPDFAYEDYRFDKFWFAAKEIVTDDAVSMQDKWYLNSGLTLSEGHRMGGTPDIEISNGGSVKISGETPQTFDKFSIYLGLENPGQFYSNTNAVSANELELNMEIEAGRWTFFTPTADVKVADIAHSAGAPFVIRYYDGESRAANNSASGNWKDVTDEYLSRGQGYIVQSSASGWLRFPVAEEHHQQFFGNAQLSIPLTEAECETTANANWNYIGNGYPTWFDIYYLNVDAPITVWTGSTYRALSLTDDEYAMRPMQGFFVQKPATNDFAVMLEQGRQLTSAISHDGRSGAPVRRTPGAERYRYDFEIQADGDTAAHDMTRIVVNEHATLRYDATQDAAKFMTLSNEVAQIFTIDAEETMLAINERPIADCNVRLGVLTPTKGAIYTISASRSEGQVYISDALTGLEYDLTATPFCFSTTKSGLDTERFTLRFAPGTSGIADIAADHALLVKGVHGAIESNLAEGTEANVYTLQGIKTGLLMGADRIALPAGVYIVTIGDETRKVIVK